jgi:hypothetical protein
MESLLSYGDLQSYMKAITYSLTDHSISAQMTCYIYLTGYSVFLVLVDFHICGGFECVPQLEKKKAKLKPTHLLS